MADTAPEVQPMDLASISSFVKQLRDCNVKRFVRAPDGTLEVEYHTTPSQAARKPVSDEFGG